MSEASIPARIRCVHCGRRIERCTEVHDQHFACRGWVHKTADLFRHGCSAGRHCYMAQPGD